MHQTASPHSAHHPAAPSPSPATTYTLITEPADDLTPIYNLLSSAKKTIDMTMYELTDITVTSMLGKAAAAGVTVRVILDQNDEKKANTPAYNYLLENKVSVHWANPVYTATHQKTITIDQTTTAILTLNLTPTDYATTRDFAVITNNANDIAAIEATFNADFQNKSITPPTGDNLVWSPTNSSSALLALIGGAKTSLLLAQEEFEDPSLEAALQAALKRGVPVTLVQENLENKYSSTLTALKSAGAKIAVYTSSTGYYIHAKTVLADYGAPTAKLFVGSENFTTESLGQNRELGLIFSDQGCMTGIYTAVTADFKGGKPF
jgi:cardiolipin synthase